jgi:hypothetical protein
LVRPAWLRPKLPLSLHGDKHEQQVTRGTAPTLRAPTPRRVTFLTFERHLRWAYAHDAAAGDKKSAASLKHRQEETVARRAEQSNADDVEDAKENGLLP